MEKPLTVMFGDWLPDLASLGSPGTPEIENASAQQGYYRSHTGITKFTTALVDPILGGIWARTPTGEAAVFCGTASGLFRLVSGGTWEDVTPTGGVSDVVSWDFVLLGYTIIAASGTYVLHKFTLPGGAGDLFMPISGSPKAAKLAVVRDFVVAGDIYDDVVNARIGTRIQWSGFNNADEWEPSLSTQSDVQDIIGRGGQIQRIVPGAVGYVFSENGLVKMSYVGPPVVFRLDEVGLERGTPSGESVCWIDNRIFYYGHDDFYVFSGGESTPLGANRVRTWLQAFVGRGNLSELQGVVDRHNARVLWSIRSLDGVAPDNTHVLEYNYAADKWGIAEFAHTHLIAYASTSITPDSSSHGGYSFDNPAQPWYGTSLDSEVWLGGSTSIVGVTPDNELGAFGGDPLQAVLTTKEKVGPHGGQWLTTRVRPLISGSDVTRIEIAIGYRDREDDEVVYTPYKTLGRTGFVPVRVRARFQRARVRISLVGLRKRRECFSLGALWQEIDKASSWD